MLILTGNNLGERHRELNAKIAEAADKKTDFEEVKSQEEDCDVDMLYKIGLASRYKNIDYILDVLKCGDVLYITRALNCLWLYDDEYSQYINSNYITNNILPYMSRKMQRKMLTATAIHLRNGERAIDFYRYCREAKLNEYAYKFVVLTPDNFKISLIKDENEKNFVSRLSINFLEHFIGRSFKVAEAYIKFHRYSSYVIHLLRFLYFVSNEWYLDLLQNSDQNLDHPNCLSRLGLRVSKDILRKHRKRVIEHPKLYINKLNKNMLVKYLTTDDVKSLAYALLPSSRYNFWSIDFYHSYKFILDKIPTNELFAFLKGIFHSKYGNKPFELAIEFYNLKYYVLLSIEERETWALGHIARDKELPGIENYIWYQFVSFKNAFTGIKQYIFLTPGEGKRSQIVNILPETARSQDDLKNIIDYYYQRHVNENEGYKESFINKVIEHHDLYSFNNECWTSLDKLFYSLEVYTSYSREQYKARSLIYHILHNIALPESLIEYVNYCNAYSISSIINELSAERNTIVAKFLINYYTEKIFELKERPREEVNAEEDDYFFNDPINSQIFDYVNKVWNVIYCFKRNHDECPEIVLQYMKVNSDIFEYHELFKPKFIPKSEGDFVRWLKQDVELAIDGINDIRCNAYRHSFRLCRLFRKLKVYFPNDVGKEYLEYFIEYLSDIPKHSREYRNIKMAVVGIFYLADEKFKVTFLEEKVPVTPKINHRNIDNRLLQVQKAICRLVYHSRPPLPLVNVHKYITGDYVHYFLPIFDNYLSSLPSISKFVEVILDAPLSIQKHGLRLAFKTYSPEALKPVIIKAWQKTKNVSLRKLLYETLFTRILNESDEGKRKLYEILKQYTSELNHYDHDDVYLLLLSLDLPDEFKGNFIETSWHTVSKLSNKTIDMNRKLSIIRHMEQYIHFVEREFPRVQIIDDHVNEFFDVKSNKNGEKTYSGLQEEMVSAKWNLTSKYIVSFNNAEEQQRSLQLMGYIMNNTVAQWDYVYDNSYVMRKFIRNFISIIVSKEPKIVKRCVLMVPFYRCILDTFTKTLKEEEMYLMTWELKLHIISRNVIDDVIKDEENTSHMLSKGTLGEFGKKIGRMVKRQVEKNEFHHCFYHSIAEIFSNIGNTICNFFSVNYTYCVYYMTETLIDIKIIETHVLALLIMPTDPHYNWGQEHRSLIKKLKEFDSKEVRSFMHKKFVQSDYSVRDFY